MGGYATATDTNESSEISGSGTANYVAKFTAGQVIGNSSIFDDGSVVGIGTAVPGADLGIIKSTSGSPVWMRIVNSSATAGSHARLQIRTEDAGDAYAFYTNQTSGTNWYTGLDSSTSGYVIGMDPTTPVPGTADCFRISSIGALTQLKYTATGLTASTENVGFQINTVSKTFATGALTTQRENFFRSPTYAFAGASTITNAYGLYIEAPIAGTNATITNNWALGLEGGMLTTIGTGLLHIKQFFGTTDRVGIYFGTLTPSASNYALASSAVGGTVTLLNGISCTRIRANDSDIITVNTQNLIFTNIATTSGALAGFSFVQAANTNQTLSTEISGFKFTGLSRQWATGAITTQRETYFSTTTYTAVGASTITDAYGMYVEAPTASTNITITNNFALGLLAGTATIKMGNLTGSTSLPAIYLNQATPSSTNFTIAVSAVATRINTGIAGGTLNFQTAGSDRMILLSYQMSTVFAGASGGSLTAYAFNSPSYTAQTASVEANYISWAAAAVQFSTGALTTQRHFLIGAPTYSFVGASTLTNAYTLYIDAPIAGTNATITNNNALGLSGSLKMVTGRIIGNQGADVASVAGAIALGTDGNLFEITGTNAITLISNVGWQNGSIVTLIFTSTATLTHGTATSGTGITMLLAGAANFVASANDTITLCLGEMGGTQAWREVSRAVI